MDWTIVMRWHGAPLSLDMRKKTYFRRLLSSMMKWIWMFLFIWVVTLLVFIPKCGFLNEAQKVLYMLLSQRWCHGQYWFLDMLNMNMEKKAIDCSEEIRRKEEIRRRRGVRRRRMRTKSKKNRMRRRAIGKQKTFWWKTGEWRRHRRHRSEAKPTAYIIQIDRRRRGKVAFPPQTTKSREKQA